MADAASLEELGMDVIGDGTPILIDSTGNDLRYACELLQAQPHHEYTFAPSGADEKTKVKMSYYDESGRFVRFDTLKKVRTSWFRKKWVPLVDVQA